jgi:hypothetical protein
MMKKGYGIWDGNSAKPSWQTKASRPYNGDYNMESSANDTGIIAGLFGNCYGST